MPGAGASLDGIGMRQLARPCTPAADGKGMEERIRQRITAREWRSEAGNTCTLRQSWEKHLEEEEEGVRGERGERRRCPS